MPLGPWILEPNSALGSLRIEAFGVALAVGLALGGLLSARLAQRALLDRAVGAEAMVFGLFGALFGARLFFALENPQTMALREVLSLGLGGLSAYGALLCGSLAAWFKLRQSGERPSAWFDVAAPGALLAASVARLGSHLGASDIGRPLPAGAPAWLSRLGVPTTAPGGASNTLTLPGATHPSALYEALGALVLVGLLLVARRYQRRSGDLMLLSVLGYSALRLLNELSRERRSLVIGLSPTEWYAVVTAIFAVAFAFVVRRRQRSECST